ncbi:competence protein ComEA [Geothermobacter ehrlichii]|uniref:Competence protein ComEA n=1 Tax=Geothermobacter ehrlichii TaxID=213224 RepID=A0A5D3WG54_9BACT|nr:helix-hairpin-helix domain-containing protein [Geothermobacter ehrlichii]TYO95671.1 competence protein ComEA [Geothermobacter ehrlichii]
MPTSTSCCNTRNARIGRTDPRGWRGLSLLVLLVCLVAGGRSVPAGQAAARFLSEPRCCISLGAGFVSRGVHQFSDACRAKTVIELTAATADRRLLAEVLASRPLVSGEHIEIIDVDGGGKRLVVRRWMSAARRIALGVPLHPDRMTFDDWQDLPGIGPTLAARIERNRQINGDFGSLSALKRVRGVGEQTIIAWKEFFMPD